MITIGLLIAAIVNNATKDMPTRASWQIPVTLQFIWGVILAVGMIFLPESPRWLIMKERDEDAARALSRLISLPPDHPELQAELNEVRVAYKQEKELGESSYLDCFRSTDDKILFRTLTGIFIQAWQQLTGINFIIYYGTVFFEKSGISNPFLIAIAINITNVLSTIPGMWGVERFGRRRLLLVGALGMCVCEFLIAIVGVTVSTSNIAGQKVLIAFVCIYIAFFASTWGPVAWVVSSEIYPLKIRAKAMSMSISSNWFWNFILGFTTPYMVNSEPGSAGLEVKVFFIWGGTCAGCFLFTYFCVPEVSLTLVHPRRSPGSLYLALDQGFIPRTDRPLVPKNHPIEVGRIPPSTRTRWYRALGRPARRCLRQERRLRFRDGEGLIFSPSHKPGAFPPSFLRSFSSTTYTRGIAMLLLVLHDHSRQGDGSTSSLSPCSGGSYSSAKCENED